MLASSTGFYTVAQCGRYRLDFTQGNAGGTTLYNTNIKTSIEL